MVAIKKIIDIFSKIFKKRGLEKGDIYLSPETEDIKPYFKNYSIDDSSEFRVQQYLKDLGTPLDIDQYKAIFDEKINKTNFIDNKENFQILTNIYEDVKIVYDKLKVLEELGVNLTLDLTGGAVRDFIMGKDISDLDIMFSFNDTEPYKEGQPDVPSLISSVTFKKLKEIGFEVESLTKIGWSDKEEDLNVRKTKLVELCLLDKVEQTFFHTEESRTTEQKELGSSGEVYIKVFRDRLCGVVKLKKQTSYKIDVLITDLRKYEFLQEFDINLCKASFVFKSKYYEKDFPKNPEHLLSRFVAEVEFFADIYNKKLTIDVNNKSIGMLDSILNKHLPKVQAKYPDYEFNLVSSGNLKPDHLVEIKHNLMSDKLHKVLDKTGLTDSKKKKI